MTSLAGWACVLAGYVSPDEEDLAPYVAEAFLQGGKSRVELFDQRGSTVGGFAPAGMILVLPVVLNAIAIAAVPLIATLSSSSLTELLGAVKNALTVAELRMRQVSTTNVHSHEPATVSNPLSHNAHLLRAVDVMTSEMRARGMSEDLSNLIAFRTLVALMESPVDSTRHVESLAAGG